MTDISTTTPAADSMQAAVSPAQAFVAPGEFPLPLRSLLDAGVHFGHQTKRWNPKMRPFIY
ncbi:MAG TPA: 30S ribosomal protein S2, partial [Candidatus Nanopelagicales bacterium]|nr:30S ribosomal protein S2 [Candidatus Nanopelagicales bacterium]